MHLKKALGLSMPSRDLDDEKKDQAKKHEIFGVINAAIGHQVR